MSRMGEIDLARSVMRAPGRGSAMARCKAPAREWEELLRKKGVSGMGFSSERSAVDLINLLILRKSGPAKRGLQGLKASSAGSSVRSAAVKWHEARNALGELRHNMDGAAAGNPAKSSKARKLIKHPEKMQRGAKSHPERRAYQLTREGIAVMSRNHIDAQLASAIKGPRSESSSAVAWQRLFAPVMAAMQLGSASRGGEMITLDAEDLRLASPMTAQLAQRLALEKWPCLIISPLSMLLTCMS